MIIDLPHTASWRPVYWAQRGVIHCVFGAKTYQHQTQPIAVALDARHRFNIDARTVYTLDGPTRFERA